MKTKLKPVHSKISNEMRIQSDRIVWRCVDYTDNSISKEKYMYLLWNKADTLIEIPIIGIISPFRNML